MSDQPRADYDEVREHVTGVLFDASEAVERDCVLCQKGVEYGVWAEFGYPDPFDEEDDDA